MNKRSQSSLKTADENQPFFVGQTVQLNIEKLTFSGGRGLARKEGLVFFVPETAPGDLVEAKIVKLKKNLAEAELLQILQPSPHRIPPECPVARTCGGCCWQHVDYPTQLKQKKEIVENALKKLSAGQSFKILDVVPSPKQFRYRNRIQVHKLKKEIGFLKPKTHSLVPIKDCLIADERLIEKFPEIRNSPDSKGRFEIAAATDGTVNLISGKRPSHLHLFSQVNEIQNEFMKARVVTLLKSVPKPQSIFDLYCGAGNFTSPLAEAFPEARVVGVELSQSSIKKAEEINSSSNTEFFAADVAEFLKKEPKVECSAVVLDPPRIGCDKEVVASIADWGPETIIYVSCNPMTLARDLSGLANRYNLQVVEPVDLFPQTEHVEVITLLQRK